MNNNALVYDFNEVSAKAIGKKNSAIKQTTVAPMTSEKIMNLSIKHIFDSMCFRSPAVIEHNHESISD